MVQLSVIIPTYNRCEILRDCLNALALQNLHGSLFEVIVGDDGSSDNTQDVLRWAEYSMPYKLIWFTQENAGPNRVRNKAIRLAKSPIVVFFNDDTIATPELLALHMDFHNDHPQEHTAFLGKVTIDPKLPYSPFASLHLDSSFAQWDELIGPVGYAVLDWRAFYTCNLSVKKSFLLNYGLFDEDIRYSDDVELGARLSVHGLEIFYCPTAIGYHRHFLTERDFLNIAQKEGKGLATWYIKRPDDCEHLKMLRFPLCMSPFTRFRYSLGDMIFHRRFNKLWLTFAAKAIKDYKKLGFFIYKKLYQSIKRAAIRRTIQDNMQEDKNERKVC